MPALERAHSVHSPFTDFNYASHVALDKVPPLMTPAARGRSVHFNLPPPPLSPLGDDAALSPTSSGPPPFPIVLPTPTHSTLPSLTPTGSQHGLMAHLLASPRPGYSPAPALVSAGFWHMWISNLRVLYFLAWPVVLSYLLQFSLGLVALIYIGHISSETLAAAALGNMFANIVRSTRTPSHAASAAQHHQLPADMLHAPTSPRAHPTSSSSSPVAALLL